MDQDIDKPMRPIIEEFNKSKHVRTVFSCAGHTVSKKNRYEVAQVYIQFEMDKEHVGTFLSLAFSCISEKILFCGLSPHISRVCYRKWPRKKRERLGLSFVGGSSHKEQLNKKQIRAARKYFQRLAEKTAQVM